MCFRVVLLSTVLFQIRCYNSLVASSTPPDDILVQICIWIMNPFSSVYILILMQEIQKYLSHQNLRYNQRADHFVPPCSSVPTLFSVLFIAVAAVPVVVFDITVVGVSPPVLERIPTVLLPRGDTAVELAKNSNCNCSRETLLGRITGTMFSVIFGVLQSCARYATRGATATEAGVSPLCMHTSNKVSAARPQHFYERKATAKN